MTKLMIAVSLLTAFVVAHTPQPTSTGVRPPAPDTAWALRGDSSAIADAVAMVETMGGMAIWSRLETVHFVHEWFPWNRVDSYVEDEVLDLTGPRSLANRRSEINDQRRAYSPEHGYWTMDNGALRIAGQEELQEHLDRAPFNFYRLVRAVAVGDPFYEVRFGVGDIPGTRRLEFYAPDGRLGGWVILNAKKEPIVKATPVYRYTLGPLRRFGNLWVPAWGVYNNGFTRYEMIALTGDRTPPDSGLFRPPSELDK